jgi:phosphoribosyl 1,2-cyclic phosphodiesterase
MKKNDGRNAMPQSKTPMTVPVQLGLPFDEVSFEIDIADKKIAGGLIADHQRQQMKRAAEAMAIDRSRLKEAPHLKFISFGSGSSGNCSYLGDERGGVLIDAGVDYDTVLQGLKDNSIPIGNIRAIILTHDHSDHVKYAYTILRKNKNMVLCCTPRAFNGILRRHSISRRIKDYHRPIYKEHPFEIGGMSIIAFEASHDGTDNAGFYVSHEAGTFVLTTDTGMITDRADYYMRQANYLVIESNYDDEMLATGHYPEYLKARIRGDRGHLSNVVAASYVASILSDNLTHLFLCHLSNDNNTHEIALDTMSRAIRGAGREVVDMDHSVSSDGSSAVRMTALPRYGASPLYILRR